MERMGGSVLGLRCRWLLPKRDMYPRTRLPQLTEPRPDLFFLSSFLSYALSKFDNQIKPPWLSSSATYISLRCSRSIPW